MPAPFHERLRKYLCDIVAVLRDEQSVASVFPNTTDIGQTKERVIAEILRLHIPKSCSAFLGGFAFNLQGEESKQLDVLVTDAQSLSYNLPNRDGIGKSFTCVDGMIAVVSVKSNLNAAELRDALENIASIPSNTQLTPENFDPRINPEGMQDGPLKIIYGSKGIECDGTARVLQEFHTENPTIPFDRRPNYIHIEGKYCWIRALRPLTDDSGNSIAPGTFCIRNRDADLFFVAEVLTSIERISRLHRHVFYDYTPIFELAVPAKQ